MTLAASVFLYIVCHDFKAALMFKDKNIKMDTVEKMKLLT